MAATAPPRSATRTDLVRSVNTGVSAFIDASGRVVGSSRTEARWRSSSAEQAIR